MRSSIILCFFCFYTIQVYAQIYTTVTIKTPNQTAFQAYSLISGDYTATQKSDIKNFWMNCYNNRIEFLGEATYKYNCHAYAWHISEGGSEVWINSPNDDYYWEDFSYAEVSCQVSATKVSFGGPCNQYWTTCAGSGFTDPCDHSAITTNQTDYFISKWGSAPLFRHHKNDCPYSTEDIHYYTPSKIYGTSPVCAPGADFRINNLPLSTTIQWTCGPYLTRVSPQGSNPCTFASTGSGSSWISANIYTACSDTIILPHYNVWSGVPQVQVTGPSSGCFGNEYTFYADYSPYSNPTSLEWSISPEYYCNTIYGYDWWANAHFDCPYEELYQVRCTPQNACGTGNMAHTYIYIYDCSYGYSISPNPASTEVTVTVTGKDQNISMFDISIYDMYGVKHFQGKYSGERFIIPVYNLKDGSYIMKIDNGRSLTNKQLIIKH